MSLYTQAEFNAALAWVDQELPALAGGMANLIPGADITTLISGVLNIAAEVRAKAATATEPTP